MNSKLWLVLDCNYLCHRAHHVLKSFSHKGQRTGAIFGLLRDTVELQTHFATRDIVFCFDHGESLRRKICLGYKANRSDNMSYEQLETRQQLDEQIISAKNTLICLGYKNVFWQDGYEADDVIAAFCLKAKQMGEENKTIIVSSDKDLYQLLELHQAWMWKPHQKQLYTEEDFTNEYGIRPQQWHKCKAVAGCGSDNVPGLKGVGEMTAARYIAGIATSKQAAKIENYMGTEEYEAACKVVKLPYEGTGELVLTADDTNLHKWKTVCESLGITRLPYRDLFMSKEQ